jgi:hypothetical protein
MLEGERDQQDGKVRTGSLSRGGSDSDPPHQQLPGSGSDPGLPREKLSQEFVLRKQHSDTRKGGKNGTGDTEEVGADFVPERGD